MLKQAQKWGQKITSLFSKFLLFSGQYDEEKFLIIVSRLPGAGQGEHHLRGEDRRLSDVHQPGWQMENSRSWRRPILKYDNFTLLLQTQESIGVEIVSAKSSEMNVVIPVSLSLILSSATK